MTRLRLLAALAAPLLLALAACPRPPERPRDPGEVAPVQTRGTTIMAPSVPGGSSGPGLGTTEPDR